MKKYKHKITGMTAIHKSVGEYEVYFGDKVSTHGLMYVSLDFSNPNWEEILEPNYLITSFRSKITRLEHYINENGLYGASKQPLINFINDKLIEIFSVKNKDGIEFTIGDNTNMGEIIGFEIDRIWIGVEVKGKKHKYSLQVIEKSKTPIFISADGKEYFTEKWYDLFCICPKSSWEKKDFINFIVKKDCKFIIGKEWLGFSTKEERQEYIDNNKPKYSLKDIEDCGISPTYFLDELKKLGK